MSNKLECIYDAVVVSWRVHGFYSHFCFNAVFLREEVCCQYQSQALQELPMAFYAVDHMECRMCEFDRTFGCGPILAEYAHEQHIFYAYRHCMLPDRSICIY